MLRTRAFAAACAAALLCGGCFVLDELEEGQKRMEQDSPADRSRAARKPETEAAGTGPGFLERAQGAIGRVPEALRDLAGMGSRSSGGGRQPRDPAERMVRCEVDGSLIFTRRIDCEARGGHISGEIHAFSPDA